MTIVPFEIFTHTKNVRDVNILISCSSNSISTNDFCLDFRPIETNRFVNGNHFDGDAIQEEMEKGAQVRVKEWARV